MGTNPVMKNGSFSVYGDLQKGFRVQNNSLYGGAMYFDAKDWDIKKRGKNLILDYKPSKDVQDDIILEGYGGVTVNNTNTNYSKIFDNVDTNLDWINFDSRFKRD